MDELCGRENFQNDIIWSYRSGGASKKRWSKKHDSILFYAKPAYAHRPLKVRSYYEKKFFDVPQDEDGRFYYDSYARDVWDDINPVINTSGERLGYPTQKPIALVERIVTASSKEGDLVLDPFWRFGHRASGSREAGAAVDRH